MDSANVVIIAVSAASVAVMLGYAVYILWSKGTNRPPMGAVILLIVAEWILCQLLEYLSASAALKIVWNKLQYIGMACLPVAWLGFCLQYTGRQHMATPRNLLLLGIVPSIILALVFTNDSHGIMWRMASAPSGGMSFVEKEFGAGFYILVVYMYALVGIGVLLLVQMYVKSRHFYRRQSRAMLAGATLPILASILDLSRIKPIPGFDVTPLALSATSLIVMYGFARLKFKDTVPVAHQATVESLGEAVVILDSDNRLMYLNPAGFRLFPDAQSKAMGERLSRFCPELVPIIERVRTAEGGREALTLGGRVHDVTVSPLFDWKGNLVSRIAVLRDITHLIDAQEELRRANEELEGKVLERTKELSETNQALRVEIGERARAEGALSASLREKEVLLKEIHHRVKNNLQVITSVLNLPMRYIADQRAVTVLKETSNRVKSIAILHEILYKSSDLSKVPVSGYIQSLITHLVSSYDVSGETVSISIEVEDILVNIDTGISCGLLINELVSNSLRHAFPAGRKGRVWVRLSEQGDRICLTVGDDGVGIPEEYDPHSAETLGLKIVDTLTRQLNGKLELKRGYGTEFSVTFGDRD